MNNCGYMEDDEDDLYDLRMQCRVKRSYDRNLLRRYCSVWMLDYDPLDDECWEVQECDLMEA